MSRAKRRHMIMASRISFESGNKGDYNFMLTWSFWKSCWPILPIVNSLFTGAIWFYWPSVNWPRSAGSHEIIITGYFKTIGWWLRRRSFPWVGQGWAIITTQRRNLFRKWAQHQTEFSVFDRLSKINYVVSQAAPSDQQNIRIWTFTTPMKVMREGNRNRHENLLSATEHWQKGITCG